MKRFLLSMALLLPGVSAWGQEPQPVTEDATDAVQAAEVTGRCLALQNRRQSIKQELEDRIAGPTHRLAAVNTALAGITLSKKEQSRLLDQLRMEQSEWRQEIVYQQNLLIGLARPKVEPITRAEVRRKLAELYNQLERAKLLIMVYGIEDAWDRQQMQARLAFDKLELESQIETIREPYREHLDALRQQDEERGEELKKAMRPFVRRGTVDQVTAEAVYINTRYEYGLILVRWNDNRGQLVSSAQLKLRASPHLTRTPPLLADQFTIYEHDRQSVTAAVGYFEVKFVAETPGLVGEDRIKEAAATFLDLQALANIIPEVGRGARN